jgi:hypothetical protein
VPLDSALIRAIVLDYDLGNADELVNVREQLEILRASAVAEDDGSFDASGMSATCTSGGVASASEVTESKTICTGLSGLSLESASGSSSTDSDGQPWNGYANLSRDAKLSMLTEMFPSLRSADVAYMLNKCDHDLGKAMDVLLNQVFFEESPADLDGEAVVTRGIDAFSEVNNIRYGRRKKNKKKKFQGLDEYSQSSLMPAQEQANKWEIANNDIVFVSSRVKTPAAAVASLYHKNGASRIRTIIALIEDDLRSTTRGERSEDTQVYAHAVDLIQDFPGISFEYCSALIRLTAPSTANAHELAKVLAHMPTATGPAALIPQYAPLKLSNTSLDTRTALPSASPVGGDSRTLLIARSGAFDNASKYYRKGKSDRLMGGAAAYYSSLGRDYSAAINDAAAAEADALVSSQSSAVQLDLHGVTVKEATRIACEQAQIWWNGLGESRIPGGGRGIGQGYRIVTGVGRHSERGVAKLGPAVIKALLRNGWRTEVGSGVLTVTGKMR